MKIKADSKKKVLFNNQVDYCIGTGRMGLALTKEYYEAANSGDSVKAQKIAEQLRNLK